MTLKDKTLSRRTLSTPVVAAAAAIAVAIAGAAIGDASSSNAASGSANTASAGITGKVIPFHRGQPSPATVVGKVPANWRAGSGTLVTGTAAKKAKAAALAAFKGGGTVNRVVRLSNGEYNVHIIGVNWPHHVFVSKSFKVVGAE
jgi:hypothetical protein